MKKQVTQEVPQETEVDTYGKKLCYEEVEVRRLNPVRKGNDFVTSFEKFKVLRNDVKITQEHADAINTGRVDHPANTFFVMYLLPGQEVPELIRPIY